MKLKDILTKHYKLSIKTLTKWKRGYVGETYVLKTKNQKYFVKIVDLNSSENIKKSLPILKELHEQGVEKINYPIITINNKLGISFEKKFLTLYNFIEGVNDFNYNFEKYSELIALIHSKTTSIVGTPKKENFSIPFLKNLTRDTKTLTKKEFSNIYQKKLQKIFIDNQSWFIPKLQRLVSLSSNLQRRHFDLVLTHGDAPGNIIHNDKGEVSLIDWDDLLLAPRERDTWFHISNKNQASNFMNCYSKIFPNYKTDQELIEFYILRRFFDDFQGPTSKILSTSTSKKEKESNLNLLIEDCLEWLKPLIIGANN